MTLSFAIGALRRRIVLILVTTLLVAGIGVGLGALLPKTYTSTARILLGPELQGSNFDPQNGNEYLRDRMSTYAAMVYADEVVAPVAEQYGLSENKMREIVAVSILPNTVVLAIGVGGDSPEQAVELTNAVSRRYESQVSSLNVATGGPSILAAQLSSAQPATSPDQLHGPVLVVVSLVAGLVVGLLLALLLGLRDAVREQSRLQATHPEPGRESDRPLTGPGVA